MFMSRRPTLTGLLACLLIWLTAISSQSAITCKPVLSLRNVREVRSSPAPQSWVWKATIAVDRTYCATGSGAFEIDFIRIKEYAPDMQFTEKFRWAAGQFDVSIELAADESVLDYRLGFIAPCVCREFRND
jgi:hypothetical protein